MLDSSPLFPARDPDAQGWLYRDHGHRVYWEVSGPPHGIPVVVFHGGPGSGASRAHGRFFDPDRFQVVLFDQRGCGRSLPLGGLAANTTAHLVADAEALRHHLRLGPWWVMGGSWGAALALAYAATHRASCRGLLLRGVFLTGHRDLDWFFHGAGTLLPEAHAAFLAPVPRTRRRNPLAWYAKVFAGDDAPAADRAVARWRAWEGAMQAPSHPPPAMEVDPVQSAVLRAKYRIQSAYLQRRCFLGEAAVLDCAARIHGLPTTLLHGRLDLICRPINAWRVHRTLHGSQLAWVDDAGHDPFSPAMAQAMVAATEAIARATGP
ncbi:MAG: alpha/beta fold hydrolase [Zoogloeaceae bacterium]|nr:alpha/beta fold hydrolase [Zoogloeaceae bacterium]